VTRPRPHPKPLEPWALELFRQDHPSGDPRTEQELAELVALLRALPDPERSPDLAHRILEHVAEQTSRPRVVHAVFGAARGLTRPGVAAMIAAGIAALAAVGVSPDSIFSLFGVGTGVEATGATTALAGSSAPPIRRRPGVIVRPQFVSDPFPQMPAAVPRMWPDRAPVEEAYEVHLDRQLNQLMIDPTAFAQGLEQVPQRDELIARLARRAAERGDAPEIALRVRESAHPLANQIVDRLLRATLVASVSQR
jgi:hypothetical protein